MAKAPCSALEGRPTGVVLCHHLVRMQRLVVVTVAEDSGWALRDPGLGPGVTWCCHGVGIRSPFSSGRTLPLCKGAVSG